MKYLVNIHFISVWFNKSSGYPLSKNTYLYEQAVDDEWIHW